MEDLNKIVSTEMTLGHVLALWEILSNHKQFENLRDKFSEDEARAIWAFQDICENQLIRLGVGPKPEDEWNELIQKSLKHVKTIPVEFVD